MYVDIKHKLNIRHFLGLFTFWKKMTENENSKNKNLHRDCLFTDMSWCYRNTKKNKILRNIIPNNINLALFSFYFFIFSKDKEDSRKIT